MIQEVHRKTTAGEVLIYVSAYAGWVLTTLLGLVAVFYTRQVLNMLWRAIGVHAGIGPGIINLRVRFCDMVGTFILLLLWAVFAFFTEHHYRSSVDAVRRRRLEEEPIRSKATASQNKRLREWGIDILGRRFLIMTSIPVILFAVAFLIGQITLWGF